MLRENEWSRANIKIPRRTKRSLYLIHALFEHNDGTSRTDDDEWLTGSQTPQRSQGTSCQQRFRHTQLPTRIFFQEHSERQGWSQSGKEDEKDADKTS